MSGDDARTVGYASPGGAGPTFELGHYRGTVDFDPDPAATEYRTNTTSRGEPELYLAGYTSTGALRFVHVFPSNDAATETSRESAQRIHVSAASEDESGITITGHVFGEVDFDPSPRTAAILGGTSGDWTPFIASFTPDGDLRFARAVGDNSYRGSAPRLRARNTISVTYTSPVIGGNTFVLGYYLGTVDFDPDPVATEYRTSTSSENNPELYLASYTSDGALRFVHVFPATGTYPWNIYGVFPSGVVTNDDGIHFTGHFWGAVDFDPDPKATLLFDIIPDGSNAFVASFTTDGDLRFARDIGGSPYGEGYDLAVDAAGNFFVTGYLQDEGQYHLYEGILIEGYTNSGSLKFSHFLISEFVDFPPYVVDSGGYGRSVYTDVAGNVVVTGNFFGILDFDPDPNASFYLTSAQPQNPDYTDPFVASYTSTGAFRFAYVGTEAPPIAVAGAAQTVIAGQTVELDGSASYDPEGGPLSFAWTLATPGASGATLSDGVASQPSFCADVAGVFTASLTVFDGTLYSDPDAVTVTAITAEEALSDLVNAVAEFGPPPTGDGTLNQGLVRALTNKLGQAQRALDRGRPDLAAVRLTAFNSQVARLQAGAHLTETQADALTGASGAIAGAVTAPCSTTEAAGPQATSSASPLTLALRSVWPNPSGSSTTLSFEVSGADVVRLAVYDAIGREVARLVDGPVAAGHHEVHLDASMLPSGVYVARLTGERGLTSTQRLTVQR